MSVAFLEGEVPPGRLEEALECEFVLAHPDAVLLLRDDERSVSPSLLQSRGVRRWLYRLAAAPRVAAREGFEEGWIDALADDADQARRRLDDPGLSLCARRAARGLLRRPSRAAALALERAEFALIQAEGGKEEGIRAFFGRRAPRFSNR
jgi:hypothetical protein